MKLFVLLMCLALERYFSVGVFLNRFRWFSPYLSGLQRLFNKETRVWNGYMGLFLITFPILVVVGFFYYSWDEKAYGMIGLLLSLLILLYCLGPDDLNHQLKAYFKAWDEGDASAKAYYFKEITQHQLPEDATTAHRLMTHSIFIEANERFFGVIFWFIVLGPLGAVFYRLMTLSFQWAQYKGEPLTKVRDAIGSIKDKVDWLPARLTTLFFIVVGNFHGSFNRWCHSCKDLDTHNQDLLARCSLAALGVDEQTPASLDENKLAVKMVDHALGGVLVVIAIFTLGAWIY